MSATPSANHSQFAKAPLSPWQIFRKRLFQRRTAMAGGVILIVLYVLAIFAGFVAPYHFERQDRERFFHPPIWPRVEGFKLVVPRYVQKEGQFAYRRVAGESRPLKFFVRGEKYSFLGLMPTTLQARVDEGRLLLGSPDTVLKQIERVRRDLGAGVIDFTITHQMGDKTTQSLELMGEKIIPVIRNW